jgi:hypothetical protein
MNPNPLGNLPKTSKPKLMGTSPYLAKDQAKSDRANKFIGRGSSRSSTEAYRRSWGSLANTGNYTPDDIVFISAEGNRGSRLAPDFDEILKAVAGRARIITDLKSDRNRSYNLGEREVAEFLSRNGYVEIRDGQWIPDPKR